MGGGKMHLQRVLSAYLQPEGRRHPAGDALGLGLARRARQQLPGFDLGARAPSWLARWG